MAMGPPQGGDEISWSPRSHRAALRRGPNELRPPSQRNGGAVWEQRPQSGRPPGETVEGHPVPDPFGFKAEHWKFAPDLPDC